MHDQAAQVVVALSGGMDSCVCAALAVRDFGANATAALHISYGQRTEAREQAAFQAVPDGCHVVMIGDVDQLPSVGPGMILRDLIDSDCVSVTRLDQIDRKSVG